MSGKTKAGSQPGQRHMADNLTNQLNSIMVQMGRIMSARRSNPDRADVITMNARKKMEEATESFHQTLDEMEIEITRAKAVFLRDLQKLQEKEQVVPEQPPAPMLAQPPAPMILDLGDLKPTGPAVPVAPMMASGGSPFMASHGIAKADGKPVAPFPDMGGPMGVPKSAAAPAALARPKGPAEQKRPPPPKQPTPKQTPKPTPKPTPQPAPKSSPKTNQPSSKTNPPSGRPANKPNPLANAQKQAPKPAPASVPPPTPAPAPVAAPAPMAVAPPAPTAPVAVPQTLPPAVPHASAAPQVPFTNATFTVDSANNDALMQSGPNGTIDLDAMLDMDSFGAGGPGDPANMDLSAGQNNDTTMGDLDHFFDMDGGSTSNFDDANFGNMDNYMDLSNDFDAFEGM